MKKNIIQKKDMLKIYNALPDNSVNVIISDLPYNIGKDFGNDSDSRPMDDYIKWATEWLKESERVLKDDGSLFVYGFSEILAYLSVQLDALGFNHRWLIWHYENKTIPSANTWQRSHESILYVWKKKPIFNRDLVREPYTEGFLKGSAGKTRKATKGRFSSGEKETEYKAHPEGALPRDVIKIPALAGGAGMKERWFLCRTCDECYPANVFKEHKEHDTLRHPTQKPLALTEKLLKSSLPYPIDNKNKPLVYIPFAGSGSECFVANKLGADFISSDLNDEYVRLGNFAVKNIKT